ncbi:B12-binding domain-containing radical SAM protein [Planctomycetota bacterium]
MRIRLIQPGRFGENGKPRKFSKLLMPASTMPTLAALTPDGIDVAITDDYVQEVDFDEDADLIGVTAMTCQAPRAYQIADEFRKRGKPVVMGGIHASFRPEEALEHCDAVVMGEAEDIWPRVIDDAERGRIEKTYRAETRPDMTRLAVQRFDLLDFSRYVTPPFSKTPCIPIQATRGCPNRCDFCSVHPFLGRTIRRKPIENVVREIEAYKPSLFFFSDDNIGANPAYARDLFRAITPLRTRWACFMTTAIMKHPRLIELAAESGCHETFVGVESISKDSLSAVHKGFNRIDEYKNLFERLAKVGILSQASFVFGFDGDTLDTLRRTIDLVLEWDVKFLYIFFLLPLPGTVTYDRMTVEGRIARSDWSLYDGLNSVLRYKALDENELEEVIWESYQRFYSLRHIARMAWRFKRQYLSFFPRDNGIEDVFFQLCLRRAVRNRRNPFMLGLERKNGR